MRKLGAMGGLRNSRPRSLRISGTDGSKAALAVKRRLKVPDSFCRFAPSGSTKIGRQHCKESLSGHA